MDAEHTARPAPPAGLAGLLAPVPADDTPTSEIPIIAATPPALPPPSMNTFAAPVLAPPPSGVPAPTPPPAAPAGALVAPVASVVAERPTETLPETLPESPAATLSEAPSEPTASAATAPAPEAAPGAAASEPAGDHPGPAIVTGPAAILSADPAFAPLDQTAPALPPATAAKSAPPAEAVPLTLDDLLGHPPANGAAKKKQQQGSTAGRALRRLVLLALLAAGGYATYEYGPGLYEEYVSKSEPAEVDAPTEADAPLAFPNATPAAAPIRTAEFILEGLPGAPDMTYRVTTDFETNVSQVDVTRPNGPDLQILTYGEAALIRNVDDNQWYQLERGRFPLDDRLERADWVRQLDELLPTSIRSSVTIDDAGETTVSGVPTRRLSLSLDVALLGGSAAPAAPVDPVDPVAPVDPAAAAAPADPAAPIDPAAEVPAPTPAPAPAPGTAVDPAADPLDPQVSSLATSVEVWVDAQGLVRKVRGIPHLGAETITVVRTDSAPWVPDYPSPEFVQPLTAATLVELGI